MNNKKLSANGSEPVKTNGTTAKKSAGAVPVKKAAAKVKAKEEMLATNDTLDDREILRVLAEVRNGNFSVRMPVDQIGVSGKICDTLNDIISLNERLMRSLPRLVPPLVNKVSLPTGVELPYARGAWRCRCGFHQ